MVHVSTAPVLNKREIVVNAHILADANGDPLIGEPFVDKPHPVLGMSDGIWEEGEVYRDVDGNGKYTSRLSVADAKKRFDQDLIIANESYAQAGIRFEAGEKSVNKAPAAIANGTIFTKDEMFTGDANLPPTIKGLLQSGWNTNNDKDLEVYYVPKMMIDSLEFNKRIVLKGHSFSSQVQYIQMTTKDFYDSVAITNIASLYTLPHEFTLTMADTTDDRDKNQLLSYNGTTDIVKSEAAKVFDTKRMLETESVKILASKYIKS